MGECVGLPSEDSLSRLADFFGVNAHSLKSDEKTENMLVDKNVKLSRMYIALIVSIAVIFVLAGCLVLLGFFRLNSLIQSSNTAANVIDDIIYTRVSEDGEQYYRVDGLADSVSNHYKESVQFPDEIDGIPVTHIAPWAFEGDLLDEVIFNDNMRYIGEYAFMNTQILSITFNDGLLTMGECAFSMCNGLQKVVLPDTLTQVPYGAFEYSTIEEIVIGSGVTEIDSFAFYCCTYLGNVYIGGPAVIKKQAFYFCRVGRVTFADSRIFMEENAFCVNPGGIWVTFNGTLEDWNAAASGAIDNSVYLRFDGISNYRVCSFSAGSGWRF